MINPSLVDELVTRYENEANIPFVELVEMRSKLASQSYWYAKLLGQSLKDFRTYQAQRKNLRSKLIAQFKNEEKSMAAAKAKAEADDEYMDLLEREETAQGSKDAGYRLTAAIDNVLDSMRQEIADLREEKRNSNYQQGNAA